MKSTILYYNDLALGGSSDKEYRIQVTKQGSGYIVQFQFGRRGGTLQAGLKTNAPIALEQAEAIYERLVREKVSKGYIGAEAQTALAPTPIEKSGIQGRTAYPVELLEEIGRDSVDEYIKSCRYWLQVKIDGHRRQVEKLPGGSIVSYNRKGELTSLPREVADELSAMTDKTGTALKSYLIDGELVGNSFVAFDLLKANGTVLAPLTYGERFRELKRVLQGGNFVTTVATWQTVAEKQAGLAACYANHCEGVCFKLISAPYRAGCNGSHLKYKFIKSCSCKVIRMGDKGHNSATLALLEGKKWREVGNVSMNGKDQRIKVGAVVEVLFLYATEGRHLYQPRIQRLREDLDPSACTIDQLKNAFKEGVAA
jgi:bifunctional non-homologous end joining protein LigD